MASKFGTKAAVLAASVAVAGITLSTSPASAAGDAQPSNAQSSNSRVGTTGMEFYDDFWTKDECTTVGDWGLDHGKWTVYDCQESLWDWDLYVDS